MSGRKKPASAEPWTPTKATERIRKKALDRAFDLGLRKHAKEQMAEREIFTGDVLHVLQKGFVYEKAKRAKTRGSYKYKMECHTPSSGGRKVCVVVIPQPTPAVVVVTVMWADEKQAYSN